MKVLALAAIAVAFGVPSSTLANQSQNTIIVENAPTVADWSKKIGARLDRNLQRLPATPEGVVAVRFRCSDEGKPTSIELSQSSASGELNDVAKRAVANLKGMHPLAEGVGHDQLYEATIIVAATRRDIDRQLSQFRQARAVQAAEPQVFALVVASTSSRRRS